VQQLPAAIKDVIVGAYNDALTPVFLYMVPLVLVAAVLLVFVKEKPLATTIEREILPESLEIDGASRVLLESDASEVSAASLASDDAEKDAVVRS
jgi:hypothetical protein